MCVRGGQFGGVCEFRVFMYVFEGVTIYSVHVRLTYWCTGEYFYVREAVCAFLMVCLMCSVRFVFVYVFI